MEKETLSLNPNAEGQIKVNYVYSNSGTGGTEYYAFVNGAYYKINYANAHFSIDRTPSAVDGGSSSAENQEIIITAIRTSGETVDIVETSDVTGGKVINISAGATGGETVITVSNGTKSVDCKIKVEAKPVPNASPVPNVTFSTEYGLIDVIWLASDTNTPTTEPNAPILEAKRDVLDTDEDKTDNKTESMVPVTWKSTTTETTTTWEMEGADATAAKVANNTWYNYANGEKVKGVGDYSLFM